VWDRLSPGLEDLSVVGFVKVEVGQLELLGDVCDPLLAEALPGEDVDATRSQHRPKGQLNGSCIRCRDDADGIVRRYAEDLAAQLNDLLEFLPSRL
jgi:hypothetical protein